MSSQLIGQILDERYQIEEVLGSGGMGTVYQARELELNRPVAIKVLHKAQLLDNDSRVRFQREGKILSSLSQKHIITFYRFGICADACPYIAMEYLPGKTLRAVLNSESTINWQRAAAIGIQVCEALQYAHERGLLHRDLKPDNLMLLDEPTVDYVKIVDFGLAKIIAGSEQDLQKLTATGQLIGSVNYLSPEQCLGQKPDTRADIYSLACVLYESLLGTPPFVADNPVGVIYMHVNGSRKPFASFPVKDVPEEFEQIISKALAKDPAGRYQSMSALKRDLELLLAGKKQELTLTSPFWNSPGKMSSQKFNSARLVCFLLCLAAGSSLLFLRQQGSPVVKQSQSKASKSQALASSAIQTERQMQRIQKRLGFNLDPEEKQNLAQELVKNILKLAETHIEQKDFEKAKSDYDVSLKYASLAGKEREVECLTDYGVMQRSLGKKKESAALFDQALKLVENSPTTMARHRARLMFERSVTHVTLHKLTQAREELMIADRIWQTDLDFSVYNRRLPIMVEPLERSQELLSLCRLIQQYMPSSSADKLEALRMINEIIRFLLCTTPAQANEAVEAALKLAAEIPEDTSSYNNVSTETKKLVSRFKLLQKNNFENSARQNSSN